jgi:hypothetical protein
MTSDGTKVFFTTVDTFSGVPDADTSADIYRADVATSSATRTLVSTGGTGSGCEPVPGKSLTYWNSASGDETCDVVAFAGGAGVASADGTIYFLSPEKLDGQGVANEANLFVARPGSAPHFVTTLEASSESVHNAVVEPEMHRYGDFQVTPSGNDALLASILPLTGVPSNGHSQLFRYDAPTDTMDCVSCPATGAAPTADTTLSSGLNISDDGRVFFTTTAPLVLRDTNGRRDVYEWKNGQQQLISTGISEFDSGLLTASASGVDVFFFTRATLVPEDTNGNVMKIYDAREGGGFLANPRLPLCVASDECHGPGTQAAPPPQIGTFRGTGGNANHKKKCRKGFVKRHGKCVKKKKHHKKKHH